jgi:hypothetical protein
VLVVEHRCFFSESFRSNWDRNSKKILMRHDRKLQGIVKDAETLTDLEKSLCYEAFTIVYESEFFLPLQPVNLADHFVLTLKRGVRSGNLIMDLRQQNTTLS